MNRLELSIKKLQNEMKKLNVYQTTKAMLEEDLEKKEYFVQIFKELELLERTGGTANQYLLVKAFDQYNLFFGKNDKSYFCASCRNRVFKALRGIYNLLENDADDE